jgi:ATP-dependent DNA helicase RecQ
VPLFSSSPTALAVKTAEDSFSDRDNFPYKSSPVYSLDLLHLPRQILRQIFGFTQFRPLQEEIIRHIMAGQDALVVMPTGGGKSLCYQIPALCRSGIAVVICPLIALMQDQVASLTRLGVRAAALNSTLEFSQSVKIAQAMRQGLLDLVYISPERLLQESCLTLLDNCQLALFAIDEAHCVSSWGHDFRPEYRALHVLARRYPTIPRLALTATADARTRQDILQQLAMPTAKSFIASFDRPNIFYAVEAKIKPRQQLLQFITTHYGQAGIIYCQSRKKVEETAKWLNLQGFKALYYHAGLSSAQRSAHQTQFLADNHTIMVATIAFGMGIDKPNIRYVIHLDLPKSLEAYYQETGRAGRDGLPAYALLLYNLADVVRQRQMIEASQQTPAQKERDLEKLQALIAYCTTAECRRWQLLHYFGEDRLVTCGHCQSCVALDTEFDATGLVLMALSCIYRTGQRFGLTHIISVLRGSRSAAIRAQGHTDLGIYGKGKAYSKAQWQKIFHQLIALNFIFLDKEGVLYLTEQSRWLIKSRSRVKLRFAVGDNKP